MRLIKWVGGKTRVSLLTARTASFLDEVCKLRSFTHLLVTSRHSSSSAHAFQHAIHLEILASDADLEAYVKSETQQDRRLAGYLKQDPSLQGELVRTVFG